MTCKEPMDNNFKRLQDVETILKIMHLKWHIENNGFRTLKQRFNVEHIYIGELNALNYMFQMAVLVFNSLELYIKIRLKEGINEPWNIITKIFEDDFRNDIQVKLILNNTSWHKAKVHSKGYRVFLYFFNKNRKIKKISA